jgi:hypothetical protein
MKAFKRLVRPLAVATAACALVAVQTTVAQAAPNTISIEPSNPTQAATGVTLTWEWSGYQTATDVECVLLEFSTSSSSIAAPAGLDVTGTALAGTYGSGTMTRTTHATDDHYVAFNNAGFTPAAAPSTMLLSAVVNPAAAGTVYVTATTYDTAGAAGACAGAVLDTGRAAYAVTANTTVSVTVDPSFSFTVAGRGSACNGEADLVGGAGSATAVALGRLQLSSSASGAQDLTVSGNAGSGFSVYVRATQNNPLRSAGHQWQNGGGAPGPLGAGERFAFTYADATASSTVVNPAANVNGGQNTYYALTSTDRQVMGSATGSVGTGCITYSAQTSATTPAGIYTATAIYTAVPVF